MKKILMGLCIALIASTFNIYAAKPINADIAFTAIIGQRDKQEYRFERPSSAMTTDSIKVNVGGVKVTYSPLFEMRSEEGETMDQFALRVGVRLRAWSNETGFEACGVIAQVSNQYGVIIGTNSAHIACTNIHSLVPNGMTATQETIHSHGRDEAFGANRADKALMGGQLSGARGAYISVNGQVIDRFSEKDFEGGAGYLAAGTDFVLHQSSRQTVRRISK